MKHDVIMTHESQALLDFPHIRMLGCRSVHKLTAQTLARHLNPGIEICYIHKGRFDWTIEGYPVSALPGTTTVTLPWQEHGGTRDAMDIGTLSWIIVHPDRFNRSGTMSLGAWSTLPDSVQSFIATRLLAEPPPIVLPQQPVSRVLFEDLLNEITSERPGRTWRVNHLVDDLLLSLARSLERSSRTTQRDAFDVAAINRAVRNDPGRKWTLDDLCALSGWSKSALNPRVNEATGYSSMEYVMVVRVELAKEHLRQTDRTITEIAMELGFFSSQHFSMVFRKRTGMTPSEYRRSGLHH